MGPRSTPADEAAASASARRSYDSPLRRQRAAQTRERIVGAGSDLVHRYKSFNWDELTFRAVAEAVGVSESTVYRHFANERELHAAVMQRLHELAGVRYQGVTLDEVADVASRMFASLSTFDVTGFSPDIHDPTFTSVDQERRLALQQALLDAAPHWSDRERDVAAGVLDVLWSPVSYERLMVHWRMNRDEAMAAIRWVIELVVGSVRSNASPAPDQGGLPAAYQLPSTTPLESTT